MTSPQMVAVDEVQVNAGMQGDFALHRDEFSLGMTPSGLRQARAAMGGRADGLITLLQMPVMDGFHFLSYLMDCRFDLPIVLRNAPSSRSAQHYLLTPNPADVLAPPPGRRAPASAGGKSRSASYDMRHGVTLLEFLFFCANERQTRVLQISSAERTAVLHLTFGKLIHASCEGREGREVFSEVMSWKTPSLRILPILPGLHISIMAPTDVLLSQAAALQQEREVAERSQPQTSATVMNPSSPAALALPSAPSPRAPSKEGHVRFLGQLRAWLAALVSNVKGSAGVEHPAR
ncbi:response regulator [Hyalangium versicolor]|uniref:response regulator n=1 Tax=Hyalangium versicolor TaxID=2861190 RepID=UPI001CCE3492|nr:response regulator [Hyalangium versicolor]